MWGCRQSRRGAGRAVAGKERGWEARGGWPEAGEASPRPDCRHLSQARGGGGRAGQQLRIHVSGPLLCSRCPSSPPYLISSAINSPRISDHHMYPWASRAQEGSSDRWPCSRLPLSLRGDVHSFIRSLTQLLLIKHLRGINTLDR